MDEFDRVVGIYEHYDDDKLRKEYRIFKAVMDIEDVEFSLLMEHVDTAYMPLLEIIADRFLNAPGRNIVYLESK